MAILWQIFEVSSSSTFSQTLIPNTFQSYCYPTVCRLQREGCSSANRCEIRMHLLLTPSMKPDQ